MVAALSVAEKLAVIQKSLAPEDAGLLRRAGDLARRTAESLATGVEAFDRLVGKGIPRGSLVEAVGRKSTGRFALVLSALAAATARGENAALVDLGGALSPRLAQEAGAVLSRILWTRPGRLRAAVRAAEIALDAGFPLVVVDLGLPPLPGARLPEAAWIRLARSAQAHGSALLLSTPYGMAGGAAEAVVVLTHGRPVWRAVGRGPRLLEGISTAFRLEKRRGARPGRESCAQWRVAV